MRNGLRLKSQRQRPSKSYDDVVILLVNRDGAEVDSTMTFAIKHADVDASSI
jgi:hypothetical protein